MRGVDYASCMISLFERAGTFRVYEAEPSVNKLELRSNEPLVMGRYAVAAPWLGLCRDKDTCPNDPAGMWASWQFGRNSLFTVWQFGHSLAATAVWSQKIRYP